MFSQVLPDWRREGPRGEKKEVSLQDAALQRSRLQQFMWKHSALQQYDNLEGDMEVQAQRLANQFMLQSLDHMLQAGAGFGLVKFCPKAACRALRAHEERFYLQAESINPAVIRPMDPGGRRRACIEDTQTKATRVELPLKLKEGGRLDRAALHLVADEGLIGGPAFTRLFTRRGLRGTKWIDPWHRIWNDTKVACRACNLWAVVQEYTIVFNMLRAPFSGSGFYQALRTSGNHFFKTSSSSNPLYGSLYDQICEQRHESVLEMGSSSHMEDLWIRLQSSPILRREGDHVRLGRWYSFFDQAESKAPYCAEMLMLLVHIGMREGWYESWESSPAGCYAMELEEESGPAEAAHPQQQDAGVPGDGAPRGVLHSEALPMGAMRKQSKNTMDLSCKILADRHRYRCMKLLLIVVSATRAGFGQDQQLCKTRDGTLACHIAWALGHRQARLMSETLQLCVQAGPVKELLFLGPEEKDCVLPGQVKEDMLLANKLLEFSIILVGTRICSNMWYTHCVPGLFALLVSESEEVRTQVLKRLKAIWEWLQEADLAAHRDAWVQCLLADMQWPSWCWVREELLLLSEFSFEHVPEDVRLDMLDLFMGVLSTNINEDAFHDLRNLERASPNGRLSRVKRWQGLVSSLLASSYDRPGPPVTEQARSDAAKELPASVFSADATDFSMGMDVLKLLGTEKYVSPSAARWSLIPMSHQCCLELKDWSLV